MSIADAWPIFLIATIVLGALLIGQIRQREAFNEWLKAPRRGEIPDGVGAWRDLFSRFERLHKDEQRRYAALVNALEHFRLAVQAMPDGVILLDGQEHIEWLNEAASSQFSLDASRDVGIQVGQLIRQSEFHNLLTTERGAAAREPLILRTGASGQENVLSILRIPFADSGHLLLSRDITDLARTEAIRRDFVANVSHELRTPLTVISGFIEQFLSEDPPEGEAAIEFYRLMAEHSERMTRLVADLLALSTLENDARPPAEEQVRMADMLESLRQEAEVLSGGKHRVGIGAMSAGDVWGCAKELRSAFGNLVSNAVYYTPEGGAVTLDWRIEGGNPTFSVADTGIGIPPEHIPRLTERFYRVDKSRSTATGGTGLGLAIVKHVLARHQGSLHIQSEAGKGSVFSAKLPGKRMVV